jgi:antitoxin component of MazEF toxin-antitoxin module
MALRVKVERWGRGLAVRIPSEFARERGIEVGTILDLESVRPVRSKRRRYTLAELLVGYKRRHRHGEWGS